MQRDTVGKIMITEEQIQVRAAEIGKKITEDFAGEEVLIIGILKGAVIWMSDLVKCIDLPLILDFMIVSSYGASTKTSGVVKIVKDLDEDIDGKNVIIVEDIVDSGTTLNYLKSYLDGRGAKIVKICSLLDKPLGRRVELIPDYVGFTVGNHFIIGYGLDFNQQYRNLPYISYLEGSEKERILAGN